MRPILTSLVFSLAAGTVQAQPALTYPEPTPGSYQVSTNVQFGTTGSDALRMDVYRPASTGRAPTLIFFNQGTGEHRAHPFYVAWARIAASKGITAILPDIRQPTAVPDFVALLEYLSKAGEDSGIDPEKVAVYAGSGNVSNALRIVEDPRSKLVKSAVMFYGIAEIETFRPDLPLLYVRAGLDRPPLNAAIGALVGKAMTQNAPVTLINHAGGRHGFEAANDDEVTRDVMEQTLNFVKRTTSAAYQSALRTGAPEAVAAGHVMAGRMKEAVAAYANLVQSRPGDASLRLAYGEALLGSGEFATACGEFEKLRGKGLGYRDLGLPAARACLQKGDPETAIGWLKSIPQRFLPPSVQNEPVFAPLKDREDFKALFQR